LARCSYEENKGKGGEGSSRECKKKIKRIEVGGNIVRISNKRGGAISREITITSGSTWGKEESRILKNLGRQTRVECKRGEGHHSSSLGSGTEKTRSGGKSLGGKRRSFVRCRAEKKANEIEWCQGKGGS